MLKRLNSYSAYNFASNEWSHDIFSEKNKILVFSGKQQVAPAPGRAWTGGPTV